MTSRNHLDWHGCRVAITGATGFVGRHLVRSLRQAGARVTALVRGSSRTERLSEAGCTLAVAALDDPPALTQALRGADVLFHNAASVDFGHDLATIRSVNVEGTRNVLTAARAVGIRRVVHTSSVVAVGSTPQPEILTEQSPWTLASLNVPYITTKYEAEQVALAANGPALEVVVGNPSCIVGPDDFSRSEFGTFCRRFWKGQMPVYFPGGSNFVDVRDVADGLLRLGALGQPGERYLLTGENRTYAEFLAALARAAERRYLRLPLPAWAGPILASLLGLLPMRPGSRPLLSRESARLLGRYFYYDSSKAREQLGWMPRPLAETLKDAHAFWMPRRAA